MFLSPDHANDALLDLRASFSPRLSLEFQSYQMDQVALAILKSVRSGWCWLLLGCSWTARAKISLEKDATAPLLVTHLLNSLDGLQIL